MTKGTILQELWDGLPESRKKKIKARATDRIEAYRTLQDVRKIAGLTQARVSKKLDMPQSKYQA